MRVCVIGAGVVGLSTAYLLKQEGHEVVVLDSGAGPASGASRGNGAQLSYSYVAPLADPSVPAKLPSLLFAADSPLRFRLRADLHQWRWGLQFLRASTLDASRATTKALLALAALSREFIEPIIEGEGIACRFSRSGKLVVYPDRQSLSSAGAQLEYQVTLAQPKMEQQLLSTGECLQREPALASYADRIAGGIWSPHDAAADCAKFCEAIAARLADRGVEFQYGRNALRFEHDHVRVLSLVTDAAPLRADHYVLAAGNGARRLGATANLVLPIYPLKGYSITLRPADPAQMPAVSITDTRRKVVFAPLGDRVRVAGFVEIGGADLSIPPARISALLDAAREVLGLIAVDGDIQPWAGFRPATPGGRPIVGRTPLDNLYLNVGHGALGWTLAAGTARLLVDAIAKRAPTIDAAAFEYV